MKSSLLMLSSVAVLLCSCESNYFNYQGTKLRKTSASRAQLLWSGDKVVTGTNSFSPYEKLSFKDLPVSVTTSLAVDKANEYAFEATGKGLESASIVGADGKATGRRTEKGVFTIVDVQHKAETLRVINREENREIVSRLLKSRGARLITTIATTAGHEKVREGTLGAGATANLTSLSVPGEVSVKFSSNSKSSFKYSDGTVFAFAMSIPAWKWDAAAQRVVVGDLVEDMPGAFNPRPVLGTATDIRKVPGIPEAVVQQVLAGTYPLISRRK